MGIRVSWKCHDEHQVFLLSDFMLVKAPSQFSLHTCLVGRLKTRGMARARARFLELARGGPQVLQ